ncbi:MAG TPA: lipase maturation factor family protein [Kofleriaceae bacterium]|nr:lipase maturation factor family protein [Kofleriaceae bacterium]
MNEVGADEVIDVRAMTPIGRVRGWLREPPSYWLTRFVLLRLLGFVYLFAFLSLANQVLPLIGSDGLLPAQPVLDAATDEVGSAWEGFLQAPSLFWFGAPDWALQTLAWVGVALAAVVLAGYANALILGALWILYFSFVTIGQDWFGFGWEMQLLETGFLAMFLVPLLDGRPFPRRRPPVLVMVLFRWVVVRIMLGAGLIKLRGDDCWQELTCLDTHFETQPLPNPLSPALHLMPHWVHALGVVGNHVAELVAPLFAFGPRRARHVAGLAMFAFQMGLILSGNLSFLNWLTLVAIVACFDDGILARAMPRFLRARAEAARAAARPSRWQRRAVVGLVIVFAVASIDPLMNLLSSRQRMNTNFNRLYLANAYGAFGSIGKERYELVLEGTLDEAPGDDAAWREYQLPCKPGDPTRRPCVVSPYHYRLDWQIWFAPPYSVEQFPWLAHLAWKLLHNDEGALSLLDGNPFPGRPPRQVRALLYRYRFARDGDAWWERERLGVWMGPWSVESPELLELLAVYGWGPPG